MFALCPPPPPPPLAAGVPLVSALSAYALGGATLAGTPWPVFANGTQSFWASLAGTGLDVIPPVAAGWDPRPRAQTPPPWVPDPATQKAYVVAPTPGQLGALVQAALEWTVAHPAVTPSRCVLLSAWNEFDEVIGRCVCVCVFTGTPLCVACRAPTLGRC